jgi:hypothetical protein
MDFHLNWPEHEDPILDFTASSCSSASFSDRLRFIGELELSTRWSKVSKSRASSSWSRPISTSG